MTTLFVIKHADFEDSYLAYNYGNIGWDGDGYFWTSKECLERCLSQNVNPHRFAFSSEHSAMCFARQELPDTAKYRIVPMQFN